MRDRNNPAPPVEVPLYQVKFSDYMQGVRCMQGIEAENIGRCCDIMASQGMFPSHLGQSPVTIEVSHTGWTVR